MQIVVDDGSAMSGRRCRRRLAALTMRLCCRLDSTRSVSSSAARAARSNSSRVLESRPGGRILLGAAGAAPKLCECSLIGIMRSKFTAAQKKTPH